MGNIAMILKRSPYGDSHAAEAVRHALGTVSFEMNVDLILVDGGVLLARKDQNDTALVLRISKALSMIVLRMGGVGLCRYSFTHIEVGRRVFKEFFHLRRNVHFSSGIQY